MVGGAPHPQPWSPVQREQVDDLIFYAALGVVLGGRLGYSLFYGGDRLAEDPTWLLRVWQGGMSFHGGFLGVLLAMYLFARRSISLWRADGFHCAAGARGPGAGSPG